MSNRDLIVARSLMKLQAVSHESQPPLTLKLIRQKGAISTSRLALLFALTSIIGISALVLTGSWPQQEEDIAESTLADREPASPPAPLDGASSSLAKIKPITVPVAPVPVPAPSLILPNLDESDGVIRDAVGDIPLGALGQKFLLNNNIIERGASLVYLLAQGEVPYKLLPIARPKTKFPILDDGSRVVTDPKGYDRYNGLTAWLRGLDCQMLLTAIEPYLPLFRDAWSYYGENEAGFDLAISFALDTVIDTPILDNEHLIRKEAVWIFEDPAVESLPALQKQVIRMGPDNSTIIRAKAAECRAAWLNTVLN